MITISKVKTKDIEMIQKKLEETNSDIKNLEDNFLVVYENDSILGFGGYDVIESMAILKLLTITEKSMELILKDGLIKALLNLADLSKIKIFIIKKDTDEKFYKNIGFKELENKDFILNIEMDDKKYIYINIDDFFNNPCKGNKGI